MEIDENKEKIMEKKRKGSKVRKIKKIGNRREIKYVK